MPMWKKGNDIYVKHCEKCGNEFIKRIGIRQKKCQKCGERTRYKYRKSMINQRRTTILERMMEQI